MGMFILLVLFAVFVFAFIFMAGKRGVETRNNEKHTKQFEKDVQEYLADKRKKEDGEGGEA